MKTTSAWNKMVHATFRKMVGFDLLYMGLDLDVVKSFAEKGREIRWGHQ